MSCKTLKMTHWCRFYGVSLIFATIGIIDTLETVANVMQSIKNDTLLQILQSIFNFEHCKLHFSSITLHVRVAVRPQYLLVVAAKPSPTIQDIKYERFRCAFQIFHILPVVCLVIYKSPILINRKLTNSHRLHVSYCTHVYRSCKLNTLMVFSLF